MTGAEALAIRESQLQNDPYYQEEHQALLEGDAKDYSEEHGLNCQPLRCAEYPFSTASSGQVRQSK